MLANAPSLRTFTILVSIVLLESLIAFGQERSPSVLVRRVVDGDTIDIALVGRVQLLGVDAPELGGRSDTAKLFAREAQQRLEGLLTNRWVRLEYEGGSGDSRRSVYVFLDDGRFVNEWIVQEGLARLSARKGLRRRRVL